MRRSAVSLSKERISQADFEQTAFWKPIEVDSAYMDTFGNWVKSPDKKAILRADTGEYVSTVGRNYGIVDNQQYFEKVINALSEAQIQYEPMRVYDDLKRTTMVVKLPSFSLFKGTSEEQDFELRIRNSFDTTLSADTILGFLRLICTNGMTTFDKSFEYRMVHKGDMIAKAEQAVMMYKNFEGVWQNTKAEITRLGETTATKDSVNHYIGDGEISLNSLFKGERWAKKLQQKWIEEDEPTNLWTLYNMFTNIISHGYGSNYSSKQTKMVELNAEVKRWEKLFDFNKKPVVYSFTDAPAIGYKNYQHEYLRTTPTDIFTATNSYAQGAY